MTIQDIHDKLIAEKPEEATHDAEACPICNLNLDHSTYVEDISIGGGDMKTYTEEEFTAAVIEAVTPLQAAAEARISEIQAELEVAQADKAKSEVDVQVADMQTELDKAEIRVADAEKRYDDVVAYFEAEAQAVIDAAAIEARKEERLAAVKNATSLSDEVIEARLDRWIAMEDDAFTEMLEDWKTVSTSSRETETVIEDIPLETAMSNIRDEDHSGSLAADVLSARGHGIDVRYL